MKEIYSNQRETFLLTWQLTSMCNFSCDYCPDDLHDNMVGFPDYELVLNFIKELSKKHKKVYVDLLGGETTLWPQLLDFLKEIKKLSNVMVIIETNGSRSTRWWEEFSKLELDMNVHVDFTYHASFCDEDLYYNNLKTIHEKYQVTSSFMLHPLHFDKVTNLYKRVKENLAVDCVYKVLRDKLSTTTLYPGYTPEMLKEVDKPASHMIYDSNDKKFPPKKSNILRPPSTLFVDGEKTNWQTFFLEKKHQFKNWKCSAGFKRLYISLDGSIWPCTAITDSGNKNTIINKLNENYMGNVFEGTYKVRENYMSCPMNFCGCKMDAVLHKYKDEALTTI